MRSGGCEPCQKTKRLEASREQPRAIHTLPGPWGFPDDIHTAPGSRLFRLSCPESCNHFWVACRRSGVPSKSNPTYAHDPEREQKEPQQQPPRHASGRRHFLPSLFRLASRSNLTPSDGTSAIVRWDAFGSTRGRRRGLKNDGRGDPPPDGSGRVRNRTA